MEKFFDAGDLNFDALFEKGSKIDNTNSTIKPIDKPIDAVTTSKKSDNSNNSNESDGYVDMRPARMIEQDELKSENTRDNETSTNTDNQSEESPIKLFASLLKEKGHIDFKDEEFRDDDDFLVEQLVKRNKDTYINSLPEEIKQLIENYEVGVPIGQLLEKEQEVFELSNIKDDDIKKDTDIQQDIVKAYFLENKWSKEEVEEKIDELSESGTLEKEALRLFPKLLRAREDEKAELINKAKERRHKEMADYQTKIDNLKNTISKTKEFFSGIPVSEDEKKTIYDSIVRQDKNGANEIGKLLSNPDNYIKVAYFLKVLNGDITNIKSKLTTKVIQENKGKIDAPIKKESVLSKVNYEVLKRALKVK